MKAKRVLVLGATGLIGHQVYIYLQEHTDYELYNIAHRNRLNQSTVLVDVRNPDEVEAIVRNMAPEVIINCVGLLISGSNRDPASAILTNAYFPHRLKIMADTIGARVIQISTDCVFSGRDGQYTEFSPKDGYDIYSKTKALGEITESPHVTLRTSVVGPELRSDGEELFHWFMSQSGTIQGYTKSFWSGVTTVELAKAVVWAIDNSVTGLYQLTSGRRISKFELLCLFKTETHKRIEIVPVDGKVTDKSLVDTRRLLNYEIPDYLTMIHDMIGHIRCRKELYAQYGL